MSLAVRRRPGGIRPSVRWLAVAAVMACAIPASADAGQAGATSTISGVVTDAAGGVIPGANVVVTSNATGTNFEAVTTSAGTYSVPALSAGTYSVSVSLAGFRAVRITDVRVQLGIPTTVNAVLEVGQIAEVVTVTGAAAELVNTQTAAVVTTLNVDQIAQIP